MFAFANSKNIKMSTHKMSQFQVSGWEDDLNDIQEEQHPHGTIINNNICILYKLYNLRFYKI